MLKEGVVNIPPEEEKAIESMLKELERFHKMRSKLHKNSSDNAICAELKQYTNGVLAPKYNLDFLLWRFSYEATSIFKAGYVPNYNELYVNLAYHVENGLNPLRNQDIDWDKVAQSIFHEWVHVKQDVKIKKKHSRGMMTPMLWKMYKKTDYYDIKWEQMALAREEIEWIKRNINIINPIRIIKWLQKNGLTGPVISHLKEENPEAYRRILKYSIMFLLKQLAQQATKNRLQFPSK